MKPLGFLFRTFLTGISDGLQRGSHPPGWRITQRLSWINPFGSFLPLSGSTNAGEEGHGFPLSYLQENQFYCWGCQCLQLALFTSSGAGAIQLRLQVNHHCLPLAGEAGKDQGEIHKDKDLCWAQGGNITSAPWRVFKIKGSSIYFKVLLNFARFLTQVY